MSESQTPATMTVEQLRGWLRDWVVNVTGLTPEDVTDTKPMENFGLSSRDAVVLSGELENLLGVQLDATIAYEYPTIQALAQRLVDGEPASRERTRPRVRHTGGGEQTPGTHDIAIVGMAGRFPGAGNLSDYWSMLVEGRDGTGELPIGRWSETPSEESCPPRWRSSRSRRHCRTWRTSTPSSLDSPLGPQHGPQQRIMLEVTWEAGGRARPQHPAR